jgi:hypothetical protein
MDVYGDAIELEPSRAAPFTDVTEVPPGVSLNHWLRRFCTQLPSLINNASAAQSPALFSRERNQSVLWL